jgi:hypothetical protein
MMEMADWMCERCGATFGEHEVFDPEDPHDGPEGVFNGQTWHRVYCPEVRSTV